MSVLIKGMKLPCHCRKCELKYWDGEEEICPFVGMIASIGRHDACPLVEIPPHGRLIDADASIDVAEGHVSPCQTTISAFLLNHVEGPVPRVVIPAEEDE